MMNLQTDGGVLMKTVRLAFQYTQDEYVKAERQYLIASKTIRKFDMILLAAFALFSIGYLFLSSFSTIGVVLFLVMLIATALAIFLYFFVPALKFKRASKYREEYAMVFSKDAITWKTATVDSELKWTLYSELWENGDFYFLIQAPQMYTLIPKRAFAEQAERQTFEEMALANLKSPKRML